MPPTAPKTLRERSSPIDGKSESDTKSTQSSYLESENPPGRSQFLKLRLLPECQIAKLSGSVRICPSLVAVWEAGQQLHPAILLVHSARVCFVQQKSGEVVIIFDGCPEPITAPHVVFDLFPDKNLTCRHRAFFQIVFQELNPSKERQPEHLQHPGCKKKLRSPEKPIFQTTSPLRLPLASSSFSFRNKHSL